MKLFFITGMIFAGFAGSITASNVMQEGQGKVTESTVAVQSAGQSSVQTQEVADESITETTTQSSGSWPSRTIMTQEIAGVPAAVQDGFGGVIVGRRNSSQDKTRQALVALKKAKAADDDDAQDDAEKELRNALNAEYDAMLETHEKQLDALEKKISELRKQLRRREDAKSELVDLRFKMLLHEADGLGWPGRGTIPSGFGIGGGATIFGQYGGDMGFGAGAPRAGVPAGGSGRSAGPRASAGGRSGASGGGTVGGGRARDDGGRTRGRDRRDRTDSGDGSGGRLK